MVTTDKSSQVRTRLALLLMFLCLVLQGGGCAAAHPKVTASDTDDASDASVDAIVNDAVVDADVDADVDASADADVDASDMLHRCYVYDDCNGGRFNDHGSGTLCPLTAPALNSPCPDTIRYCFYCEPFREAWHWSDWIPEHYCKDGLWTVEYVAFACE